MRSSVGAAGAPVGTPASVGALASLTEPPSPLDVLVSLDDPPSTPLVPPSPLVAESSVFPVESELQAPSVASALAVMATNRPIRNDDFCARTSMGMRSPVFQKNRHHCHG